MSNENEEVKPTGRLSFGDPQPQVMADPVTYETDDDQVQVEAPVADEVAQQEIMTAEAEETPVATTEAVDEAAVPVSDETNEPHQSIADDVAAVDYHADVVEQSVGDNTESPFPIEEDAATSTTSSEDTINSVEDTAEVETADDRVEAGYQPPIPEGAVLTTAPVAIEDGATGGQVVTQKSVNDLKAERDRLDGEIATKQTAEKTQVIAQIKTVAETYGVTVEEIVEALGGLKNKRKGVPVPAKYRDPVSGSVWSGRGKEPSWIKNQDRTKFAI